MWFPSPSNLYLCVCVCVAGEKSNSCSSRGSGCSLAYLVNKQGKKRDIQQFSKQL